MSKKKKKSKAHDEYHERLKHLHEDWHPMDVYSFDITTAAFLSSRLRWFADEYPGWPGDMAPEKWKKILNKMARGFEIMYEHSMEDGSISYTDEEQRQINKSLKLFKKYFHALWC